MRVRPELFDADKDAYPVLQLLADDKYSNRVVPNVGLCISVFDFVHIGDSHIFPGDGAAHTEVEFRMIVFRPSKGQILEGVVHKCTREGIKVSVGFFADVWVPAYKLHQPSVFNPKLKEWEWKYDQVEGAEENEDEKMEDGEEEEEGGSASNPFFYTVGDKIRVRVTEIEYTTLSRDATTGTTTATTTSEAAAAAAKGKGDTGGPGGNGGVNGELGGGGDVAGRRRTNSMELPPVMLGRQRSKSVEVKINQEPPPAMRVVASVDEDGLGMVQWWPDADAEQEEEEEEQEV